MAMKRCNKGHYFDESKHTSCPSCGIQGLDVEITKPLVNQQQASPTMKKEENNTVRANYEKIRGKSGGETVALVKKKLGIDPCVGWLVCVEGPDKGRDYRLHTERNFIGRSQTMDVQISGDETISRENHAIISFNGKNRCFKIQPGTGRAMVYVNDCDAEAATELRPYDLIEIGQTKLMFVPFCGEIFSWD